MSAKDLLQRALDQAAKQDGTKLKVTKDQIDKISAAATAHLIQMGFAATEILPPALQEISLSLPDAQNPGSKTDDFILNVAIQDSKALYLQLHIAATTAKNQIQTQIEVFAKTLSPKDPAFKIDSIVDLAKNETLKKALLG